MILRNIPKIAKVVTPLQAHQQRIVDRLKQEDQPGLVALHGLGSGKTLSSIAAHDALGLPADIVVPAALQENYAKEIRKHHDAAGAPPHKIHSLQNLAAKGEPPTSDMLIVDEAHRIRDTSSKGHQVLKKSPAKKRLLLSATPFYNRPSDIAPLVNMAAGASILPANQSDFEKEYVAEKVIKPSIMQRLRGVKPGSEPILNPHHAEDLKKKLRKWVDYYEGSKDNFPSVTRETVKVPMSKKQTQVYDAVMDNAPAWVQWKVRSGLPPSKSESSQLNAFLGAVRQVSNSTRAYQPNEAPEEPKIEAAFQELKKGIAANPRHKAVVYSNYIDSGLNPYKERLKREGIPFGEFTGEMKKTDRDQLVQDYNNDKIKALLVSSAGAEGLDLKGTRQIQILEPHWNDEKIKQVEGRGIRYKSHAHLPSEEQKVHVQRFLSVRPKSGILERIGAKSPGMGVDEYMSQMAAGKDRLNEQFRALLRDPPEGQKS